MATVADAIIPSVGIISVVAGTVTTILGLRPKPTSVPAEVSVALQKVTESIEKLTESQHSTLIQLATMLKDMEHMRADFEAMVRRFEKDHMELKLLRETIISWAKLDGLRERGELGEGLDIPG